MYQIYIIAEKNLACIAINAIHLKDELTGVRQQA
jgi:hypothetical protein